jgi:hypothetical protein
MRQLHFEENNLCLRRARHSLLVVRSKKARVCGLDEQVRGKRSQKKRERFTRP